MKKTSLVLLAAFSLVSAPVLAEENPNQDRIDEIEAEIKELQEELKDLKGNSESDTNSIGDSVEIGDYTIKITEAYYTNERVEFEETDPDKVLVLSFELTNNSDEELTYTSNDFKVYVDNKEMKPYALEAALGNVSPGRTVEEKTAIGIIGDGDIEIEWQPSINFDDLSVLWVLDDGDIDEE